MTATEKYYWLLNNCFKMFPASRDGPEHPGLFYYFDLWGQHKETHTKEGLDKAIEKSVRDSR